jgi:hypothetical protein
MQAIHARGWAGLGRHRCYFTSGTRVRLKAMATVRPTVSSQCDPKVRRWVAFQLGLMTQRTMLQTIISQKPESERNETTEAGAEIT